MAGLLREATDPKGVGAHMYFSYEVRCPNLQKLKLVCVCLIGHT
jgi:hypothetical protein